MSSVMTELPSKLLQEANEAGERIARRVRRYKSLGLLDGLRTPEGVPVSILVQVPAPKTHRKPWRIIVKVGRLQEPGFQHYTVPVEDPASIAGQVSEIIANQSRVAIDEHNKKKAKKDD